MRPAKVLSLGYERRTVEEIIAILSEYRIKRLLDIRESPRSRRKGFSKNALDENLRDAGIKYLHLGYAGNPYRADKQDIKKCLRLYRAYLKRKPEVIELVANEIRKTGTAILCYEREYRECHRSVLLEALQDNGHLLEIINVE